MVLTCEQQELRERLNLEKGQGRVDDVQIEVVGVPENQIARMLTREASSVPNGPLMAGGLTCVHDRQLS